MIIRPYSAKIMAVKQKINSPLLYRLLDEDPEKQYEKNSRRFIDINDLEQDIRNNLEMILNTRSYGLDLPEHLTELKQSVLNYGIKSAQMRLCRNIKEILEFFEPRLQFVNVSLLDSELELDRILKIRIEGMINIGLSLRPAAFESCLDIIRQHFVFAKDYL
jgi:type VI secretion system protein ImpF